MANSTLSEQLLRYALTTDDTYIAAGFHGFFQSPERQILERVIFSTARLKRLWSGLEYTPLSILHSLAFDWDTRIKLRVAKHSQTRCVTLSVLAQNESDIKIMARIASHVNASIETLIELFKNNSNSPEVRQSLCRNANTPGSLLPQLVEQASIETLKKVVQNVAADAVLLEHCWKQNDLYLQAEVAAHHNCPQDLLHAAEQSNQCLLRRKLAENPGLSEETLVRLLKDKIPKVRAAAVKNLNKRSTVEHGFLNSDPSQYVRRNQARYIGLPEQLINRLASDNDPWVRRLVANNPGVTSEILGQLAGDSVMEVRRAVTRHSECPKNLLAVLAEDSHPWVRAGVALRSDVDKQVIMQLSSDTHIDIQSALGRNPSTPQSILKDIASHQNRDVRRSVVLNTNSKHEVLRVMFEDPYPLNRVFLVGHKNIDDIELQSFLTDPEPMVRFAVAKSLASRLF